MTLSKNPKSWLLMILVITFLLFVLIIYKHHCDDTGLQQKIDNHSEIVDKMQEQDMQDKLSG